MKKLSCGIAEVPYIYFVPPNILTKVKCETAYDKYEWHRYRYERRNGFVLIY